MYPQPVKRKLNRVVIGHSRRKWYRNRILPFNHTGASATQALKKASVRFSGALFFVDNSLQMIY